MTPTLPGSGRQPVSRLISRALRRRCPNCGAAGAFVGYWTLAPYCPNCGHKFLREPGYWVGAVIFNTALTIAAFLLTFAVFLVAAWPEVPWDWLAPTAIGVTVIVPVLFYPWAQTLWMAYDLFVHPLELKEQEAGQQRIGKSPPTTHVS
jgi:uncharacterized protein (DUF983 family)